VQSILVRYELGVVALAIEGNERSHETSRNIFLKKMLRQLLQSIQTYGWKNTMRFWDNRESRLFFSSGLSLST
jgi:hypothetical protein